MFETLKTLYCKLPIARELKDIRTTLRQQGEVLIRLKQDAFVARLLKQDRYAAAGRLNRHERQVFSQNGEDGVIQEIFRRIGNQNRTFVEIGVGDGLESNTTFLLTQGWSGFWVDGNEKSIAVIRKRFQQLIAASRLTVVHSFVTAENIERTLREAGVPPEIDLLSVDIDRNTYWVWAALPWLRPRAVVVEYNSTYPPEIDWKVEYDAGKSWKWTSYFGASLKAFELLGRQLGYCLVGCELSGINAFFVREDLCGDKFERPFTAEAHYEPPRYFLVRTHGHKRCFGDSDGP